MDSSQEIQSAPSTPAQSEASATQQQGHETAVQSQRRQAEVTMRQAQAAEQNSRTVLNVAQSERYGVDSLKDAVDTNRALLQGYDDGGAVQECDVSQDDLLARMKAGQLDSTKVIGIPDGFTKINGRYEQTFALVTNPAARVPLTQQQVDQFKAAGVPDFDFGASVPDGIRVPGTVLARAVAQGNANSLMLREVNQIRDTLSSSPDALNRGLAKGVGDFRAMLVDSQTGPSLQAALARMQRYVSYAGGLAHDDDFFQSLQKMSAPMRPDPSNPKQSVPNADAPFAQTVAVLLVEVILTVDGRFYNGTAMR